MSAVLSGSTLIAKSDRYRFDRVPNSVRLIDEAAQMHMLRRAYSTRKRKDIAFARERSYSSSMI